MCVYIGNCWSRKSDEEVHLSVQTYFFKVRLLTGE